MCISFYYTLSVFILFIANMLYVFQFYTAPSNSVCKFWKDKRRKWPDWKATLHSSLLYACERMQDWCSYGNNRFVWVGGESLTFSLLLHLFSNVFRYLRHLSAFQGRWSICFTTLSSFCTSTMFNNDPILVHSKSHEHNEQTYSPSWKKSVDSYLSLFLCYWFEFE